MPHRDQELEAECRGLDVCTCVHVLEAHYRVFKIVNLQCNVLALSCEQMCGQAISSNLHRTTYPALHEYKI